MTESTEQEDNEDNGETKLGEASTDQNAVLQALTTLHTELKDFKQGMRRDLDEFKNDVKKVLKDDLAEFKGEVMRELQSQNANIAEAQTRIADMETACLEMKETLLAVVKENTEMRGKIVDLESRSRRNNIRIYGVPEEKEGGSVIEFVNELFKRHLALPEGLELRVQRAHRALIPKPAAASSPRSIIIALREKGIRFRTPYTKMRVQWDSGLVIYSTAEEAAQDLNRRGIRVKVMTKANTAAAVEERLNAAMPWKRITCTSDSAAQHARERLTEFRRDIDQGN
ncbi:hypothetical protein D5F01_LYC05622 [Larimichthys crocea]|uniref:L1 transposable element RRM domain-containing protein n=1 Tax=Larimichthys crocea TaxID=215358 RepID=A0A6G0IZY6_LARCR|nr:hypothetical protein D5F01_LYC05622 [Larimichthys crocea]